jgi:hypothetical protein
MDELSPWRTDREALPQLGSTPEAIRRLMAFGYGESAEHLAHRVAALPHIGLYLEQEFAGDREQAVLRALNFPQAPFYRVRRATPEVGPQHFLEAVYHLLAEHGLY